MLQLKQQFKSSLEGELENVKSKIVKILREKAGSLEENGILKEYKTSYEDLAYENKQLKSQILQMLENKKLKLKVEKVLWQNCLADLRLMGKKKDQPSNKLIMKIEYL